MNEFRNEAQARAAKLYSFQCIQCLFKGKLAPADIDGAVIGGPKGVIHSGPIHFYHVDATNHLLFFEFKTVGQGMLVSQWIHWESQAVRWGKGFTGMIVTHDPLSETEVNDLSKVRILNIARPKNGKLGVTNDIQVNAEQLSDWCETWIDMATSTPGWDLSFDYLADKEMRSPSR